MGFDWIDRRVPEPDFETILRGALTDEKKPAGFNQEFWYPVKGGIEALPEALAARVDNICLDTAADRILPDKKQVVFAGGKTAAYDHLVYTLPLTRLPGFIGNLPKKVSDAIAGLKHNKIECVNIGINRPDISPYHWLYFYEDQFIFHRINFPRNFSEKTCPGGTSSVCCEIAHSDWRPLPVEGKEALVDETIRGLCKAGILSEDDEILVKDVLSIDPAYVIYDLNHHKNVKIIHQYLESKDIFACGRFGEWQYFNMDHSILSGKRVAEKINQKAATP
jgi:UDP-galactopyranose mutase